MSVDFDTRPTIIANADGSVADDFIVYQRFDEVGVGLADITVEVSLDGAVWETINGTADAPAIAGDTEKSTISRRFLDEPIGSDPDDPLEVPNPYWEGAVPDPDLTTPNELKRFGFDLDTTTFSSIRFIRFTGTATRFTGTGTADDSGFGDDGGPIVQGFDLDAVGIVTLPAGAVAFPTLGKPDDTGPDLLGNANGATPTDPTVTARTAVVASDPEPISFTGTNLSLTVLDQQVVFPSVAVDPQLDGSVRITGLEGTAVSLAGGIVTATIVANPGLDAISVLDDTPAELLISAAGIAAQLAVNVHVTTPGVVLGGTFALDLDTTIVEPHVRVTADNVAIALDGPDISADLVIRRGENASGEEVLLINASDVSLAIPADPTDNESIDLVSIANGSGTFVLDSAGLAGTAAGTLATNIDDLSLAGTGRVAFNTAATAVDVTAGDITLQLPGGPFARIE
ncbi:MAG: hypothetical protein ACKVKO_09445, partial [Acidimicrobiales bacterium]